MALFAAAAAPAGRFTTPPSRRSWLQTPQHPPFAPPEHVAVTDQGVGVPRRQEVIFRDGSALVLLRVMQAGTPSLYLRELAGPAAGLVVDLRQLAPALGEDLPTASTRDVPGIVHFGLRLAFPGAQQLIERAMALGGSRA